MPEPEALFQCPRCGSRLSAPNATARRRVLVRGACQACRAARTLRARPELLDLFVAFWRRSGFPESPAWLAPAGESPAPGDARHAPRDPAAAAAPWDDPVVN